MLQFKPEDIPNTITLVADLYSSKRSPTKDENEALSKFFMTYMGKAIEDCQSLSKNHWMLTRPTSDVAFNSKVVDVKSGDFVTEFIVATTCGPNNSKNSFNSFTEKTTDTIIKEFSNNENSDFIIVYNKLVFGFSKDRKFINGLFVGVRFNRKFFEEKEPLNKASESL